MAERDPHRRGPGDHGHAALTDRFQGGVRVEALHQHHGGATFQAETEDDVEPEDVVERQHPEHHVVREHLAFGVAALVDVGQQVAVAEHRRLR